MRLYFHKKEKGEGTLNEIDYFTCLTIITKRVGLLLSTQASIYLRQETSLHLIFSHLVIEVLLIVKCYLTS